MLAQDYRRGEIYYIMPVLIVGSEQKAGRPGIIVSNDKNNKFSSTIEIVFLTSQHKTPLPTHVEILSASRQSTALCEQINSVSIERIGSYIGKCSDDEIRKIDAALAVSLELQNSSGGGYAREEKAESKEEVQVVPKVNKIETEEWKRKYSEVNAQLTMVQKMYYDLLKLVFTTQTVEETVGAKA